MLLERLVPLIAQIFLTEELWRSLFPEQRSNPAHAIYASQWKEHQVAFSRLLFMAMCEAPGTEDFCHRALALMEAGRPLADAIEPVICKKALARILVKGIAIIAKEHFCFSVKSIKDFGSPWPEKGDSRWKDVCDFFEESLSLLKHITRLLNTEEQLHRTVFLIQDIFVSITHARQSDEVTSFNRIDFLISPHSHFAAKTHAQGIRCDALSIDNQLDKSGALSYLRSQIKKDHLRLFVIDNDNTLLIDKGSEILPHGTTLLGWQHFFERFPPDTAFLSMTARSKYAGETDSYLRFLAEDPIEPYLRYRIFTGLTVMKWEMCLYLYEVLKITHPTLSMTVTILDDKEVELFPIKPVHRYAGASCDETACLTGKGIRMPPISEPLAPEAFLSQSFVQSVFASFKEKSEETAAPSASLYPLKRPSEFFRPDGVKAKIDPTTQHLLKRGCEFFSSDEVEDGDPTLSSAEALGELPDHETAPAGGAGTGLVLKPK